MYPRRQRQASEPTTEESDPDTTAASGGAVTSRECVRVDRVRGHVPPRHRSPWPFGQEMAHTVVLSDNKTVEPEHQREILAEVGADIELLDEKTEEAVAAAVQGADGLIVDASTPVTATVSAKRRRSGSSAGSSRTSRTS